MATIKTAYTGSLSTSTNYALSESPILTKASPWQIAPVPMLTVLMEKIIQISIIFRKSLADLG
jgi:hypothetical protein